MDERIWPFTDDKHWSIEPQEVNPEAPCLVWVQRHEYSPGGQYWYYRWATSDRQKGYLVIDGKEVKYNHLEVRIDLGTQEVEVRVAV